MSEESPEEVPSNIPRLSPNCHTCNPEDHIGHPHNFHTDRQHDNWWQMMLERQENLANADTTKEAHSQRAETIRGLFDE